MNRKVVDVTEAIVRSDSGPREVEEINHLMGVREWIMITILSVMWGGSFFFIEIAVRDVTPLTVVWCRVSLASMILLAVARLKGYRLPSSRAIWGELAIMALLSNVFPFSLIVWGQTHIESGLASILNGTTPIFSVILTHFLALEEKLTANRIVGVLVGWLGVAVLIGIESLKGFGVEVMGQIAVLVAAFAYACGAVYGRRFRTMSTLVVTTGMICCSAVMMTPLALIVEQPWHLSPGWPPIAAVCALAVISTSIAYLIYFRVLAVAGPTNILLVTFLVPISAILLGYLLLGERLGWNVFAGMGLVLTGLAAIDGRMFVILNPILLLRPIPAAQPRKEVRRDSRKIS